MLGLSYGTVLKLKKDGKLRWLKMRGECFVYGKYLLEYIGKEGEQSAHSGKEYG
jgi:hypothetical protein